MDAHAEERRRSIPRGDEQLEVALIGRRAETDAARIVDHVREPGAVRLRQHDDDTRVTAMTFQRDTT